MALSTKTFTLTEAQVELDDKAIHAALRLMSERLDSIEDNLVRLGNSLEFVLSPTVPLQAEVVHMAAPLTSPLHSQLMQYAYTLDDINGNIAALLERLEL